MTQVAGVAGPNRQAASAAFQAAPLTPPMGIAFWLGCGRQRCEPNPAISTARRHCGIRSRRTPRPIAAARPRQPDLVPLPRRQGRPRLLESRLKPLAAPGNAWRALAREQLALLDLRQGRTDAAKTQLQVLSVDPTAPNGVRARASALLERAGG
jgi:hypothetical protein